MHSRYNSPKAQRIIRTGSALVLVIGALAMISVFAAIYLAIGRGDRQNAAALRQRTDLKEYREYFTDHIIGVIGKDRLDVYPVLSLSPRGDREYYRETIDYPYTDWTVRSQPESEAERFFPSGRHLAFLTGSALDPRVPYDPWLSSTEPEYLGSENIEGGLTAGARFYSETFSDGRQLITGRRFLDNLDWRQISNLAVDGRFVNLWNLRPGLDVKSSTVGGFDAQPGFGTYREGSKTRRTMSYGLSLLNRMPDTPFLQAFDPTVNGTAWIPGYDTPQPMARALGITNEEIANVPAAWTMNQRYLFSPANQPYLIFERQSRGGNDSIAANDSPDLMSYQYADADGDGMYDSRFIELIDASDGLAFKNLLPFPIDDLRLFAAIRVEDLSARVNVNAHGDQTIAPSKEFPLGLTPTGAVDLRRYLGMVDFALETGLGFSELDALPAGSDAVQNYQEYDYINYPKYREEYGKWRLQPAIVANLWAKHIKEMSVAEEVGYLAYDAIRLAIETGTPPGNQAFGPNRSQSSAGFLPILQPDQLITSSRFGFTPVKNSVEGTGGLPGRGNNAGQWIVNPLEDAAQHLTHYYDQVGGGLPISSRDKKSPLATNKTGQLFGMDDLAELLTYRGVNDPRVTSRLEQATGGRADVLIDKAGLPNAYPLRGTSRRFDPLHNNRPLVIDRFGHADGRQKNAPDSLFNTGLGPRVNGRIDPDAMILFNSSPRRLLTTFSGMTPLPSGTPIKLDLQTLRVPDLDEQKLTVRIKNLVGSVKVTFSMYARTLLRESSLVNHRAWRNDLSEFDRNNTAKYNPVAEDTAFYGHRGPELALRIAAHLAVNLSDMVDEDDVPTAATLLVDSNARNTDLSANGIAAEHPFPWIYNASGRTIQARGALEGELIAGLDYGWQRNDDGSRGTSRLPGDTSVYLDPSVDGERQRRAVNIFGIEPMPVLTEVAILNLFTDAPDGPGGGDMDFNEVKIDSQNGILTKAPEPDGGTPPGGPANRVANMTLDTEVPDSNYDQNSDFLFQALVFQIHNPYPEAITFEGFTPLEAGEDPNDEKNEFSHYLEYAGRFFRLGQYSESWQEKDVDDKLLTDSDNEPVMEVREESLERYEPVTIGPGKTAVFYVLMNEGDAGNPGGDFDWEPIETRVKKILEADGNTVSPANYAYGVIAPGAGNGKGEDMNLYTGLTQEWFEKNLRDNGKADGNPVSVYRIREFSPATGEYTKRQYRNLASQNLASVIDMEGNGEIATAARSTTKSVRLWRKLTTHSENNANTDNVISNDLLADRLEVGDSLQKEFSIPAGGIGNTVSIDLDFYNPYTDGTRSFNTAVGLLEFGRNDNTGWTVAQWAGVRRSGREFDEFKNPDSGKLIRGAVLPAMIATEVVKDEVDSAQGKERRQVRLWTAGRRAPAITQLNDLAEPIPFQLIDSPNFKNRLIDMLRMNMGNIVKSNGDLSFPLFDPALSDEGNYSRTVKGPVMQGMALQPHQKVDWLDSLVTGSEYYASGAPVAADNTMDEPVVKSLATSADYSEFDLDYDKNSKNLSRVNPDLAFGMQNTNKELRYTIRPVDLLSPFAVGPVHAPNDLSENRSNVSQNYDPSEEWITFPEMLAITLGYRDVKPEAANKTLDQLYGLLWLEEQPGAWTSVLDSGKLRLDRYTSFFDMDADKDEKDSTRLTYPGNFTPMVDKRRGTGVPIALELLGEVRGVGSDMREIGWRKGMDWKGPGSPPPYSYNERFDGRTDIVAGKININTAPLSVLRLLAGLTPNVEYYDAERANGYDTASVAHFSNDWTVGYQPAGSPAFEDGLTFTDFGTPRPDAWVRKNDLDTVRDSPDRASMLIAYRDRNRAWPMPYSDPVTVTHTPGDTIPFSRGVDFTPFTSDSPVPWRKLDRYISQTPSQSDSIDRGAWLHAKNFTNDRTRQIVTGIPALRESPGFTTVGEVLAVTLRTMDAPETDKTEIPKEGRNPATPKQPDNNAVFDFNRHNMISSLGFDGEELKAASPYYDSDTVSSYDASIYSDGENDAVVDEADERTAIAGAIMNSIDVRSDTFVVWFVLQAYRPEDVEDLRPSDPLIPSYQRRFMMVIDRSNVVTEDDTPKVVLFREVPM